ncbi:hydroxypyruvate isomerase [Sulfurisoma sediminicola]|uniref:Hydroxypyruvate isomerase n=1 Tax=Sulfurisoma sediminicola TaxID=1381557 RepID=A0A497XJE9_9PROT|nr:hydroxypyruvate isomerase [Sulfurisoma sediminicola]RLJ67480.1 hydroxypyruvate isomerase [Sulfurisoma sediminicola]
MPRLAANLTMLFNEVPFLERFDLAAAAGFSAVEFLFPYDYTVEQLRDALGRNKLQLVLHNLPAGNWAGGDRGIACDPARVQEFRDGVDQAIAYATALGVPQLNCLAGIKPANVADADARRTLVENLKYAAPKLSAVGIRLLIEAINTFDIPGFFLNRTQQALDIIAETGSDNLFVQYDIYHMQRMEGELAKTMENNLPRIAHMQLADNPGRNEPGSGEINYHFLFAFLDKIGYQGWIGCEYKPAATTAAGLGWAAAYLKR